MGALTTPRIHPAFYFEQSVAKVATTKISSANEPSASVSLDAKFANASGSISGSTWLSDSMARLIKSAEEDSQFAKEMAETFTNIPDKMLVNLAEAPSFSDKEAFSAWEAQSAAFDKVAAPVTAQRVNLYNAMKDQGASDVDIFKAIVSFNSNLPADYQIKAGFLKVNTFA